MLQIGCQDFSTRIRIIGTRTDASASLIASDSFKEAAKRVQGLPGPED